MTRTTLSVLLATAVAATVAGAAIAAPQSGATRQKIDLNNDGVIDRTEAAAHPRLAASFDQLDKNRDGKLDASERPHHRKGGHDRHGGGMDRIVKADTDGDGRISRTEAGSLRFIGEKFAEIDSNRDGYIVRSELTRYHERMRPQHEAERAKRAEERFAAADLNKDGKLSRVEVSEKMPRLEKSFAFMDEDRDGFLTRADLAPPKR
ncbi:EF-hand domain-containing protein [Lysobacter soli]|uniref:EF-hand domain-containing protein n=1 Tax=Lysobacter soli TaxID=453783 RepID=UPI0024102983|nr:EF-hand domain-containing protein [Lysobacter soli]MDG2519626.1 EF-hand domain-containing protein [Lysobacter soli]